MTAPHIRVRRATMIKNSTKPKTRRASAPRAPKSVSLESQAGDDGERLADLKHLDELCRMKDRLFGLEAAILGACDGGSPITALHAWPPIFQPRWKHVLKLSKPSGSVG
jgi:hypothetical protein